MSPVTFSGKYPDPWTWNTQDCTWCGSGFILEEKFLFNICLCSRGSSLKESRTNRSSATMRVWKPAVRSGRFLRNCFMVLFNCFFFQIKTLPIRDYLNRYRQPCCYPVLWIRIRIGSGSRRANMNQKNIKQWINFVFWSAECSLLRAEGFSRSLEDLYEGLVNCNFLSKN
jgi:hypothetical protein